MTLEGSLLLYKVQTLVVVCPCNAQPAQQSSSLSLTSSISGNAVCFVLDWLTGLLDSLVHQVDLQSESFVVTVQDVASRSMPQRLACLVIV